MVTVPQIQFQEHRLENGLQVMLYRNNRVPLVHLSLHFRVGSSYERPGFSGFAHLFEHMMFQGSHNVAKNEHGKYVDAAGGSWNASTSKDRTNYYETLPAHFLERALWLEADRMGSLKVTVENFENQRQTVIEEKKQSYDNRPYGLAYLRFDELAYDNWAYAHPIIGCVEDLEKITLEDARNFHQTYYGPGNAVLIVAGDIHEREVLEKIQDRFGSISNRTQPKTPDLHEPEQKAEKVETLKDSLAVLSGVSLGYHMPELGSSEYYALSTLALILSHGESSRLYRKLVSDNNWISSLSVGPNQYKGPELFTIMFQVQDRVKVDEVLKALEGELEAVQENPVSEQELEKAKNQIMFQFVAQQTKVSRVGECLAHYAVYFNDPQLVNSELDRFLSVTGEDILRVARQTFYCNNRTLISVEPGVSQAVAFLSAKDRKARRRKKLKH